MKNINSLLWPYILMAQHKTIAEHNFIYVNPKSPGYRAKAQLTKKQVQRRKKSKQAKYARRKNR